MAVEEIDFPREPQAAKLSNAKSDLVKANSKKRKLDVSSISTKTTKKNKIDKKEDAYAGVWQAPLKVEDLTEGIMGLGIVHEIKELEVVLQTAFNNFVSVPVKHMGVHIIQRLKSDEVSLDDIFHIGQFVSFRIVEKASFVKQKKKIAKQKRAVASADPTVVNKHIVPAQLSGGLVLGCIVKSIEEKGAVCEIGISGVSGFIKGERSTIREGQVVLARVESVKSRVVFLSTDVEASTFANTDALHTNHLMPGVILDVTPDKISTNGVFVSLGNRIRGFIHTQYLPPRLRLDTSRFVESLRAVIVFCQQNSNILVLNAHPDVVAISKNTKRVDFHGIQIGERIQCRVSAHIPKAIVFTLAEESEKKPTLLAFANKNDLEPGKGKDDEYALHSICECRVIGVNIFERLLKVSNTKAIMGQQMVSYKEAIPGALVKGTVVKTTKLGVVLKLFKGINGFAHLKDVSDRDVQDLKKLYPVGKEVQSRIIAVDHGRKNIRLTLRKSLIEFSGPLITSFSKDVQGQITRGIIGVIFPHGAAVVNFFNGVSGYMPASELKKLHVEGEVKKGSAVDVLIANISDEGKILVKSPESQDGSSKSEKNKAPASSVKAKAEKLKLFDIYTAKVTDIWKPDDKETQVFGVEVRLPNGIAGRIHASELPTKYLVEGTKPAVAYVKNLQNKNVNLRLIGYFHRGKDRLPEFSANEDKLSLTKKKQKLLGFAVKFDKDELIPIFSYACNDVATQLRFQVSPLYDAVVPAEKLPQELLAQKPKSKQEIVPIPLDEGEMRLARVDFCNRKHKRVEVHFGNSNDVQLFKEVTVRALAIYDKPMGVTFQLPSGQVAHLGPTGACIALKTAYSKLHEFVRGEVYKLILVAEADAFAKHKQKWELISEKLWRQKQKATAKRPIIVSTKDFTEGDELQGFVTSLNPCFVEIGPGVNVVVSEEQLKLHLNDLVNVQILAIDHDKEVSAGKVLEVLKKYVAQAEENADLLHGDTAENILKRKRAIEMKKLAQNAEELTDAAEEHVKKARIEMEDPGWNFSNEGFTPQDLLKVAQLVKSETANVTATNSANELDDQEHAGNSEEASTDAMSAEKRLLAIETRVLEGETPETDAEFGIALKKEPNSATLWIQFISYFLNKSDLASARATAERALETINYREETERLALWSAYLNLEVSFGSPGSWRAVFERACGNADSLKIHKQVASILAAAGQNEDADEVHNLMIKRFRQQHDEVWVLYAIFLKNLKRDAEFRDLMKRALASVPKERSPKLIVRFATIEFEKGDVERARTMFESVLSAVPKKLDIWNVFIDLSAKYGDVDSTRQLFDRVCNLQLSAHKLRPIFKKWSAFEEKHGDEQSQGALRERAASVLRLVDAAK